MAANPWRPAYNSGMAGPNSPTEELVEEFRQGRQADESFRILFRRYFAQVQWFFQRKGASPEDARDLAQEVFLSVFKGLTRLQDARQFTTWLFVIARNVFSHHLEKLYTQKRTWASAAEGGVRAALDPEDVPDSRVANAADAVLNQEKVSKLSEALSRLPAQMRRCIQLRAEEYSYEDIAALMGISAGAVKSHIHRAREKLREDLRLYFQDIPV